MRLSPAGGPPERGSQLFPLTPIPTRFYYCLTAGPCCPPSLPAISASWRRRKGRIRSPWSNTPEETGAPMTLAGPREIAFVIGAGAEPDHRPGGDCHWPNHPPHRARQGRDHRVDRSPDGATLYFCAGGTVWADPAGGGEARTVSSGESVVMEPSGGSLIVTRGESAHTRMFHVPLDGSAEREIPSDPSSPSLQRSWRISFHRIHRCQRPPAAFDQPPRFGLQSNRNRRYRHRAHYARSRAIL